MKIKLNDGKPILQAGGAKMYLVPTYINVDNYNSFKNTFSVYKNGYEIEVDCPPLKYETQIYSKEWQLRAKERASRIAEKLFNKYIEA